ncbi:MAG TPA: alpha/beta hydrolase [Jatrophihabitantaceae bacterium]|nr:alpha/beta hydrolase [Jatrophihabitantaceae bacterium]
MKLRTAAAVSITSAVAVLAACTSTISGSGTALSGSRTPSSSAPSQAKITFTDCSALFNLNALPFPGSRAKDLSIGCGRVSVPLDYDDPSSEKVDIELVRVHDKNNTGERSLLVNPGGPGGSGVSLAVGLAAQVSDDLLAGFDIVGFDPRGVGLSDPIDCVSNQEKDDLNAMSPDVRTAAGFAEAKQAAASVARACRTKYGDSLAQFNTVETAKDMDRIRQALGEDKLDYLGFSYGTELGSTYAHLFPKSVGAFVLDGAVDPTTDPITSFAKQLGGFEGAFDQFAADCITRSPCSSLGDPRQAAMQVVDRAASSPIPSSKSGEKRRATRSLVLTGILSALYSKSSWGQLGESLIAARKGDSKGLLALADQYNERNDDGSYANLYDANTTISCNDSKPGPSDATVRSTTTTWVKAYPMFGLWAAASLFSCQQWQPDRTPVPLPSAATPEKVLVVGNVHDPATPYEGAKHLVTTMGNAELLTWDGEGHTSFLSGSSCIDDKVDTYLLHGTLPPDNTTCPR